MLFERFEDPGLSQYSYAVGCPADGRIAIVDPRRDVEVYLRFAAERGVRISHVLETHIHADYASGARELAHRTGAALFASGHDRGERFEVSMPHQDLIDGESIEIGPVRIEALHTPGHTPEHLSFLIYDRDRSTATPMLLLSGDFLLIGTLGRPDLLGDAETGRLAKRLFASVREVLAPLPDGLEIHPAHGAGSLCGAGMSGRSVSTLGYERAANPYLDPNLSRDDFIARLRATAPPRPPYYTRMKGLNAAGPALLAELPARRAIGAAELRGLLAAGHVAIDLRDPAAYGAGHVRGSLGIGNGTNLSAWAAWVVPYDTPIVLIGTEPGEIEGAVRALARVGLDEVAGYLAAGIDAWQEAGFPLAKTAQAAPREVHDALRSDPGLRLLDVRTEAEWRSGHVPGAFHLFAGELEGRLAEVPRSERLALLCGSGYRSTVAAGVLERAGFEGLVNVAGGIDAWRLSGLPVAPEPPVLAGAV